MSELDTHGYRMKVGHHAGELITRVPVGYLKRMVNTLNSKNPEQRWAVAELARRGTAAPELDVSGHAIDRASQSCLDHWRGTRKKDEGLHSWLCRIAAEALEKGKREGDKVAYAGMKFVFEAGQEWPVLKTVMSGREQ